MSCIQKIELIIKAQGHRRELVDSFKNLYCDQYYVVYQHIAPTYIIRRPQMAQTSLLN